MQVATHQQHVCPLVIEQADQVLQTFLLEKTFVVQIRNKGNAKTVESSRHIGVTELVRPYPADAPVAGTCL